MALEVRYRKLEDLIPYARNARTHSDDQAAQIASSIREFGFTNPVLIDGSGGIIAGHGRVMAARKLKMTEVPVIELAHLTETQKQAYILADNKLALNAGWDEEMLRLELADLEEQGFDLDLTGFSLDEIADLQIEEPEGVIGRAGNLSDRFMIPSFTVLNAREGWWQSRKKAWLSIGIKSELGRGDSAGLGAPGGSLLPAMKQSNHVNGSSIVRVDGKGRPVDKSKYGKCLETGIGEKYGREEVTGTSIFDPVLCEIAYRWFSPVGGLIIDPFAGGSVRGIVASKLGRQYVGYELRPEQVEANRAQGEELCMDDEYPPAWILGDSQNIDKTCADINADMVFSCPPYADLEVYSDNECDLSTMKYEDFRSAYFSIIKKTCSLLKQDSFACFVVGEVRDKKGNYIDFVGDTVKAFREAGLSYYNEAILITCVGSLPIRAGKCFSTSRKLGKTHQNVLVFVKGNGKSAASRCGLVEVDELMFEGISLDES